MPIAITPAPPAGLVGPGIFLGVVSSFIGPLPTGTFWRVNVYSPLGESVPMLHNEFIAFTVADELMLAGQDNTFINQWTQFQPADGDTINVTVDLIQPPSTVIDHGAGDFTWSNTAGVARLLSDPVHGLAPNGLNSTEQAQLAAADSQSANAQFYASSALTELTSNVEPTLATIISNITATIKSAGSDLAIPIGALFGLFSIDHLTTIEVTSGPTSAPVNALLNTRIYGFIVRVTTLPVEAYTVGIGNVWVEPPLARFAIDRGGDELYSQVIHNPSTMIYPAPGVWSIPFIQIALDLPFTPPDYTVHVEWAAGAAGQVFVMSVP